LLRGLFLSETFLAF